MPDYSDIVSKMTSPEGFQLLTDGPKVIHVKQKAQVAYDLWTQADERFIGAVQPVRAPGGTGTGLVIFTYWNPDEIVPDRDALALAINTALPVKMIKEDNKASWKSRNPKQNAFFFWQGMKDRPLSQWLRERFGVYGVTKQVIDAEDFAQDVAVVVVKDGLDRLWTFTTQK